MSKRIKPIQMKNKFVSVILPTSNRYDVCLKNINNILEQDYKSFEIIVCDDSDKEKYLENGSFLEEIKKHENIKYLYCARYDHEGKKDYGLARARNFGIIEAKGEYLVFLDDRITPAEPDMITQFAAKLNKSFTAKVWLFGDKGAQKDSFVENCSAIRRDLIIDAGMFCERIDKYGGMTREVHRRFSHQGFKFLYLPQAKAKQVCKSSGWDKKPTQIEDMKKLLEKMFDL
jgi:glycosyltransferase involved in cell wall biosynthesis